MEPINYLQPVIYDRGNQHPIHRELAEIIQLLERLPRNNGFTQSIVIWTEGFVRALNHPNPQSVIERFAKELESILRFPGGENDPLPREIFEDHNPLLRLIIGKMTDPYSALYSPRIAQEKQDTVQGAHLPADVIEQIRKLNALGAQRDQEEANFIPDLNQLNARLQWDEEQFQARQAAVMQRVDAEFQALRHDIAEAAANDLAVRNVQIARAEQLLQEARELRADADRLQREIDAVGVDINNVQRANAQLQVEINNTQAAINEKKADWLMQVACLVASVVISWVLECPVTVSAGNGSAAVGCTIA